MTLEIVTRIGETDCLSWTDGYFPPREADYDEAADFLKDAAAFWDGFWEAMAASGIDPDSALLAGCLPDTFADGDREFTLAYTAAV